MRKLLLPLAVAALLTAACTVNIGAPSSSTDGSGGSNGSGGASTGASTDASGGTLSGGSTSPDSSAPAAGTPLVPSAGLTQVYTIHGDSKQLVTHLYTDGSTVFATLMDTTKEDDADLALMYSPDGGATWKDGGMLLLPGNQYARGLVMTPSGLVIVGVTAAKKGDTYIYSALIVSATGPDYQIKEIPAGDAFAGKFDVSLSGVAYVDNTIVIGGSVKEQSKLYPKYTDSVPTLWATNDNGNNWVKKPITVKGSSSTSSDTFIVAPDGSWNMVGQGYPLNNGKQQFSASWIRSTDGGDTWTLQYPALMDNSYDQGATGAAFTADSKIGIMGWDEQTEKGDDTAVIWTDSVGDFQRVGGSGPLPMQDDNLKGEFVNGIAGYNNDIIVWGSPTGEYPTQTVRFWKVTTNGLETLYDLAGKDLYAATAIPFNGGLLVGGSVGENRDATLWFGKP